MKNNDFFYVLQAVLVYYKEDKQGFLFCSILGWKTMKNVDFFFFFLCLSGLFGIL